MSRQRSGKTASMNKIREILRLRAQGFTQSEIARGAGVTRPTVRDYVRKSESLGITAESIEQLSEDQLRELFGKKASGRPRQDAPIDFSFIHRELSRPGVTRQLLWREYLRETPHGVSYSRFCERYYEWGKSHKITMRIEHRAGEKAFVDYAGQTVIIYIGTEEIEAQIFVGALGASHLIYAEATPSQEVIHWLASHVRMFAYFGGVPECVVPDNLASGVTKALWYEPGINRSYEELARYYGVAVLPTRVKRPRDKAKAETAVQIVEREILAPLRDRRFVSLAELNDAIRELLEAVNTRQMSQYARSRRELFEEYERPQLRALPSEPFTLARWRSARVHVDYHIEVEKHYYSVPHHLIGQVVEAKVTERTVECFFNNTRVALHARSVLAGRHTTDSAHRPVAHNALSQWTPQRFIEWAHSVGSETVIQVEGLLRSRPHPELAYRSILGLLRLQKTVGAARLEKACATANTAGVFSYLRVKALIDATPEEQHPVAHHNLRGQHYYH